MCSVFGVIIGLIMWLWLNWWNSVKLSSLLLWLSVILFVMLSSVLIIVLCL